MLITFRRLSRMGTALAFVVVVVGAWVRLTDAGLGCPDWPGCYGRFLVPIDEQVQAEIEMLFPERPIDVGKAWREMFHRYLASALGLVCVALAALSWMNRRDPMQPRRLPLILLSLVIFQGVLGMWTVTMLLKPIIVLFHLLGGLATLGLLSWMSEWRAGAIGPVPVPIRLGTIAVIALFMQIALGGWTSTNYAALACPDFPTCQTQWWPQVADFREGFVLWRGVGIDYEGGILDHPARVAIHFTHRLGAILAAFLVGFFGWRLFRENSAKLDGALIVLALVAQLFIGASVIIFGVPLAVAVAHNGGAALLLLVVLNGNQRVRQK